MQTTLHIGAGQTRKLESYLDDNLQQVILIEPQPELAQQLRDKTAAHAHVQVLELAVSDDPQQTRLHQFNLSALNSLYTQNELKQQYPGIREQQAISVNTIPPQALIESCQIDPKAQNRLILDAPGAEAGILQTLHEKKLLTAFTDITLTTPEKPLYSSNSSYAICHTLLSQAGYEQAHKTQNTLGWIEAQYGRKQVDSELEHLRQQLAQAQQQASEYQHKLEETHEWFSNRKKQALAAEETIQKLNDEISKVQQELQATKEQLATALEATKHTKTMEQTLIQLQKQIRQLHQAHSQQLQQNTNALGQHITRCFSQLSTTDTPTKDSQA